MNFWIVWLNNFHGVDEFNGAFSSFEKAQEYVQRFSEIDQSGFRIEESTLDDY